MKRADFSACSGCGLCQLVCPVWRSTRDVRLTPHGRAKARQHGATLADLAPAIEACTLCAACEPVCPENIALVDDVLQLRGAWSEKRSGRGGIVGDSAASPNLPGMPPAAGQNVILLADRTLRQAKPAFTRAQDALRAVSASDHGDDIAAALEQGLTVSPERRARFLAPLRGASRLVVANGLLLRALRDWLPDMTIVGIGEALGGSLPLRASLGADDLYVIESRAFHIDYEKLVQVYDALRIATGVQMNLDLQRIAVPTTACAPQPGTVDPAEQARWILEGRVVRRIIVEDAHDLGVFRRVTDTPVLHVAELA
jgi:NAD-dependent dihydropyrimidine dehydrogenase PreA subunit